MKLTGKIANPINWDLALNGDYVIELFSFHDPPKRISRPEATGLRYIAFEVDDLDAVIEKLKESNIIAEPIRVDKIPGKQFTFIFDPDNLPVEL
jgi:glyoxylase I family protein